MNRNYHRSRVILLTMSTLAESDSFWFVRDSGNLSFGLPIKTGLSLPPSHPYEFQQVMSWI